jgi:hypothetical protein
VGSIRDDAVAWFEASDLGPGFLNDARVRIAKGDMLVEFGADGFDGSRQAVGSDFVENHTDFLRLLPRFLNPARTAKFEQHPFSP